MAFMNICGVGFDSISSSLTMVTAIASVATGFIIALGYLLGEFMQNPKLTVWAKTEFIQLFVSLASVILLIQSVGVVCTIKVSDLGAVFGISLPPAVSTLNVFDGAQQYLVDAAQYIHMGINTARFHLGAYDILNAYGLNLCGSDPGAVNVLLCLFGGSIGLGGGAGIGLSRFSGWGLAAGEVNFAFGSMMLAHLSALNYLIILRYIYSGMVFFFLPIGIVLRAMPFMRQLGSLFISLSFSFLIIYPLMLSLFYLDTARTDQVSVLAPRSGDLYSAISSYATCGNAGDSVSAGNYLWPIDLASDIFDQGGGGSKEFEIARFAGHAVLIGIFIPSLALIASIASVMYVNRFLGQEVDLSRIVQMM